MPGNQRHSQQPATTTAESATTQRPCPARSHDFDDGPYLLTEGRGGGDDGEGGGDEAGGQE